MATSMDEIAGLQRLLAWLSPAFPTGGFAYSAGLETAIVAKKIHDRATLTDWLTGGLSLGTQRTDAIILAEAWRQSADPQSLADLTYLTLAMNPARERSDEMLAIGAAFLEAVGPWNGDAATFLPKECPYPVAVGAVAGAHRIDLSQVLLAFLTLQVQSQISVAVRLVPIGQSDGLKSIAALEPIVAKTAQWAATSSLTDLGAANYAADIAAMNHQSLQPRIFRS